MKSANIRYLPGLDHLRAFAALLIVFYHSVQLLSLLPRNAPKDTSPLWGLPRNPLTVLQQEGHTAVALFMVLSGFVFTIGAQGRELAYWPYLKNRFLRIYPLFIVMMLVAAAAIPHGYSALSALQTLLFQANLPGAMMADPFTSMFWAVAVEFQFYLVFPFLHRALEREGARWGIALVAMAMLLRYAAVECGVSNARDISYWHILGRIDQFMLGMLAARLYARIQQRELWWGTLSVASFLLVLAALMGLSLHGGWDSVHMWKIAMPTIEGLVWALFLVSYVGFAQRHPGRWSYPLVQIGTLSYSIYMLHFIALRVLPKVWPLDASLDPTLASQIYTLKVVLPLLLPASALSYYVFERPFLKMRGKYLGTHHTSEAQSAAAKKLTPLRSAASLSVSR